MRKDEILSYFNGVNATARALGISKSSVSLWPQMIPWKYALLAHTVTAGGLHFDSADYPEINQLIGPPCEERRCGSPQQN